MIGVCRAAYAAATTALGIGLLLQSESFGDRVGAAITPAGAALDWKLRLPLKGRQRGAREGA